MMKRIFIAFGTLAILAAGYGSYLYFKTPLDIRQETPDYFLSAAELASAYMLNEDSANARFVDKILVVSGEVTEVQHASQEGTIFLASGDPLVAITCSFYADEVVRLERIKKGDRIWIKGKCTGKLMDVVLNNCSIQTKP